MMAPTMTKMELRTAQRMREIDSPPTSVNFSMSVRGQRSRKGPESVMIILTGRTDNHHIFADMNKCSSYCNIFAKNVVPANNEKVPVKIIIYNFVYSTTKMLEYCPSMTSLYSAGWIKQTNVP